MTKDAATFCTEESCAKLGPYKPATKEEAANNTLGRPIRVYADGIYDLFHAGHAKQLQQCKNLFPEVHLIVGCCNDKLTHSKKGFTVNNEWERYENISHCRYVDEILADAPWSYGMDFLEKYRIDFIAHDDEPYTMGGYVDVYAEFKKNGRFCATQRTPGVSTSDLITRIIKNYDNFIRRQLKRGVAPRELNLSKFKEQRIQIQDAISRTKQEILSTTHDVIEFMTLWKTKHTDYVFKFLRKYTGVAAITESGEPVNKPRSMSFHSDDSENEENDDQVDRGNGSDL